MPKVTYVQPDGAQSVVDVPLGTSVMKAAIANGIRGIVAECGGSCMCATCHVYVDEAQADWPAPVQDDEDEMLDVTAATRKPSSRLSCQLTVTEALDGLIVHIPDGQV